MSIKQDNNTTRIAKNTIYMFFRMILVLAVGLYSSRVVLETLGVEDFGVYNVVGGVVVFFSFLKSALTNATYRFLAFDIGNKSPNLPETFSMTINAHLILTAVCIVLSETLGLWFLNAKLNIPAGREFAANIAYQLSILCFAVSIMQTPYNSAIIAHESMSFYAYTSIIEVALKLAVIYLLLVVQTDKLILYSFLIFVVTFLIYIWYYIHCKRSFDECTYHWCWNSQKLKEMVNYSGWSLVVNMADVSINQSIVFFFNIFFGVIANAALGVANQVNTQLNNFLSSFTQAYNPQIIKSYAAGNQEYFMKLIFSTSKLSYYMLLFVSVPLMLNIDYILTLWLKTPPEGASLFVILVIGYSLVDAYSAPLWTGVHATGNIKRHQILMSSIKILNIPMAYFMLKFGCAAWTALLLKIVLNIICSIVRPCYVRNLYGLPLSQYFRQVWAVVYLVTIIVLPLPVYLSCMMEDGLLHFLITSSVFCVIAVPVIYFVGLDDKERDLVNNMIKQKLPLKK